MSTKVDDCGEKVAVRLCGVPEHFNLPVEAALRRKEFERAGIDLEWRHVPQGTGAMIAALSAGEVDVALCLFEGAVAATCKANSGPSRAACAAESGSSGTGLADKAAAARPGCAPALRLCGEYVTAPLRWMIATGSGRSDLPNLDALQRRFAEGGSVRVSVSRLGSGSHLMAFVLALQQGWPLDRLSFLIHDNFRAMRSAVVSASADVFLWELGMTSPFVHSGELRELGWIDTPWHCFSFVAREDWLAAPRNRAALAALADVCCRSAAAFVADENSSCEEICARYGLSLADAHAWMRRVSFAAPLHSGGSDGHGHGAPFTVAAALAALSKAEAATDSAARAAAVQAASPLRVSAAAVHRAVSMLTRVGVLSEAAGTVLAIREIVEERVAAVVAEDADIPFVAPPAPHLLQSPPAAAAAASAHVGLSLRSSSSFRNEAAADSGLAASGASASASAGGVAVALRMVSPPAGPFAPVAAAPAAGSSYGALSAFSSASSRVAAAVATAAATGAATGAYAPIDEAPTERPSLRAASSMPAALSLPMPAPASMPVQLLPKDIFTPAVYGKPQRVGLGSAHDAALRSRSGVAAATSYQRPSRRLAAAASLTGGGSALSEADTVSALSAGAITSARDAASLSQSQPLSRSGSGDEQLLSAQTASSGRLQQAEGQAAAAGAPLFAFAPRGQAAVPAPPFFAVEAAGPGGAAPRLCEACSKCPTCNRGGAYDTAAGASGSIRVAGPASTFTTASAVSQSSPVAAVKAETAGSAMSSDSGSGSLMLWSPAAPKGGAAAGAAAAAGRGAKFSAVLQHLGLYGGAAVVGGSSTSAARQVSAATPVQLNLPMPMLSSRPSAGSAAGRSSSESAAELAGPDASTHASPIAATAATAAAPVLLAPNPLALYSPAPDAKAAILAAAGAGAGVGRAGDSDRSGASSRASEPAAVGGAAPAADSFPLPSGLHVAAPKAVAAVSAAAPAARWPMVNRSTSADGGGGGGSGVVAANAAGGGAVAAARGGATGGAGSGSAPAVAGQGHGPLLVPFKASKWVDGAALYFDLG